MSCDHARLTDSYWVRSLLSGLVVALCLFYAALCGWILNLPPSIPTDDAFFFASSLTRYSILDFSPHFPGYPAFVGLGRIVHMAVPDPVSALVLTTSVTALSIPPALAVVTWRWSRSAPATAFAFALAVALPLLPTLAVSGLSDGTGLLFLLVFFACIPKHNCKKTSSRVDGVWWFFAGIAVGVSACARPSYGPILVAACTPLLVARRKWIAVFLLGAAAVVFPSLAVIFAVEGWNYALEGWRFFQGHIYGWGNTVFSARSGQTWIHTFTDRPLVFCSIAIASLAVGLRISWSCITLREACLISAFVASVGWTLVMQNPENLRHLAPILLLGALMVSLLATKRKAGVCLATFAVALNLSILATHTSFIEVEPPIAQAAKLIDEIEGDHVVLTREGVHVLRSNLETARVYDLASPAAALSGLANGPRSVFRLTGTFFPSCESTADPPHRLSGRVLGERSLLLIGTPMQPPQNACLQSILEDLRGSAETFTLR